MRKKKRRRRGETKSTRLALAFLLSESEADRDDAFDGLTAVCWRAKWRLYIAPSTDTVEDDREVKAEATEPVQARSRECGRPKNEDEDCAQPHEGSPRHQKVLRDDPEAATRKFIQIAILEILNAYRQRQRSEIFAAASAGKFDHIPLAVRNRMIDAVRSYCNNHRTTLSLDKPISNADNGVAMVAGDTLPGRSDAGCVLGRPTPPAWNETQDSLNKRIESDRDEWIKLIGERGFAVLATAVDLYSKDAEAADFRGRLTSEVAARLGVSERTARAERARLNRLMREARKDSPRVKQFRELFEPRADEARYFGDRQILPWDGVEEESTAKGLHASTDAAGLPVRR